MSVEDRYYKINRILLKFVGIWPFEISKWSYIKKIIVNSIFLSMIFVQLTVFITHECTLDIVLKVSSFISPCFVIFLVYNLYYFEMDMIKKIFKNMYYDWKSFKDKTELNIMDHYASTSKLFAEMFLFLVCIAILGIIINNSIPPILDIISPLNESRKYINYIEVEYFVDRFKYQNFIMLHLTISILVAIISLIATGSTLLSIGYHACAMFKVANYRMEITMDEDILRRIHSSQIESLINKRIISAVSVHRRAIQYCKILCFQKYFFLLVFFAVISMSTNLFRLLISIKELDDIISLLFTLSVILGLFIGLFLCNHIGQLTTNVNTEIIDTIYSLPWYIAPLNIQKLLLFLLQKGNKTKYLTIGGIFYASYEGFATLATASISYLTVFYTIREG